MANDRAYADRLTAVQNEVLEILRTFEFLQENLLPGNLAENQGQLVAVVGDKFRRFEASFAPLTPPDVLKDVHQPLCEAIRELN